MALSAPVFFMAAAPQGGQMGWTAGAGVAAEAHGFAVDSAPKLDDATIVAIFDAANTADIETGQLATQRGQNKDVRAFGAMLARDHKAVQQQGRDLAKKLGVTPTPLKNDQGAKAHAQAMKTLRATPAASFDHVFLQHEIAFHKSVLDAMKGTIVPAIKNAELKAFVLKVAPAFEAHMIAAQQLDQKLSGKGTGAGMSH
jgi:putative membrane protein